MARLKSRYLGVAGAALLAAALTFTSSWEGRKYVAYQDVGGVWTICDGIIKGVKKGDRATDAQCDAMLLDEIVAHETRLLACAPEMLNVPDKMYIAVNDWAFNVGTGAACSSTLIRKVKAGDNYGACNELSKWVYVNGNVVKGLKNRRVTGTPGRISERALCLEGLKP